MRNTTPSWNRNPPTSSERRACENLASHSSLSSQASQARPGRPASQASRTSKPQASRHRCQQSSFYRGSSPPLKAATGGHRPDSPLSLRRPLQLQGGQPSMPQTHQISMIWPTSQQIESWDDHFKDLGYPSKFYRVQDASFIDGSSI